MSRYLTDAYRRDILGESLEVVVPEATPKLIEEVKAEIARIDALRLGANLARRDSVSYQNRRALEALLEKLKTQQSNASDQVG